MAAEKLGDASCPLCRASARVSLSRSGYAVLTCNGCNMQLFTRSPRSDELVRDRIKPVVDVPARVVPADEPAAALRNVAPAPTPSPKPEKPDVAPASTPAAPARRLGLFPSWT